MKSKATKAILQKLARALLALSLFIMLTFSLSGCCFLPTLIFRGLGSTDRVSSETVATTNRVVFTDGSNWYESPDIWEEGSDSDTDKEETGDPTLEEKYSSHVYINAKDKGACRSFSGNVGIFTVFVTDPESSWSPETESEIQRIIESSCEDLSEQAKGRGVSLSFGYTKTGVVFADVIENGSTDWADQAAKRAGFSTLNGMAAEIERLHGYDSVAVIFAFNRNGRAYAMPRTSNNENTEYAVIYQGEDAVGHELLHLYGAKDFYYPTEVHDAASEHLGESIMNHADTVDDLTAYLVGWTNTLSEHAASFLGATEHLTKEDLSQANDSETFTGWGKKTYASGNEYTGDLVFGTPHGEGSMIFASGDAYSGEWKNGKINGRGVYKWASGLIYEGEFSDGSPNGYGKMVFVNGDVYEGEFLNGQKNGRGTYTWASGDVYSGDWVLGEKEGTGEYRWTSGSVYTGEWKNGKMNGYGKMVYANGSVREGQWKDNAFID